MIEVRNECGEISAVPDDAALQMLTRTTQHTRIGLDSHAVAMTRKCALRLLQAVLRPAVLQSEAHSVVQPKRSFHPTQSQATDGVYEAITKMRTRTPWIEALRESMQHGKQPGSDHTEPVKLDLTPKTMSNSFVRFVGLSGHSR